MGNLWGWIGGSALTVVVILYLFNRPDKFEHWMKLFYQFIYFLSINIPKIKGTIDKRLVAVSIQDTVNHICDQINEEAPDILPHALKIEWVKSDTPNSFISKGKAVVRLKHYDNQDRNIVESTLLYLRQSFLPRAKNYLDKSLRQSCEYKIASRVFISRRDTGAFDYFIQNEMEPATQKESSIQNDLQLIENLDGVGFLTRVFLSEVTLTGQKLLGTVPTDTIRRELRDFANFLDIIARKGKDEYVPLSFKGSKVKVAVILVAKRERITRHGIKPYIRRIENRIMEGYDSIYLAAWGNEFIRAVLLIKGEIEKDIITIIRRYDYPVHGTTKATLMVCQPKSGYLAQQKKLYDEVRQAFMEIVPEVKDGLVNIVAMSRIKGLGIKVAVRAAEQKIGDPIDCCIGINAGRLNQLKERFPTEFMGIARWSDDTKEFIANAIRPLHPRNIVKIEIDDENLIANVLVNSHESLGKAIGKGGSNVKLASELTGFFINIELPPELLQAQSPEDELIGILKGEIPEILNKEIEIVRVARHKGSGSKVIVKWVEPEVGQKYRASEICYGRDHETLRKIRPRLLGERVYFHDWCESSEEQITACLYPIKSYEIDSVEIDDSSQLAVVTLNTPPNIPISGEYNLDLELCEEVTGFQIEIIHR